MKKTSTRAITAALFAGLTVLTACSTPPGPDPATPAPKIPEDAVAYDEVKSLEGRKYPFAGDCSQIKTESVTKIGFPGTGKPVETPFFQGCVIDAPEDSPLNTVDIGVLSPDRGVERVFSQYWDGSKAFDYFRRTILLDRYYAVSTLVRQGIPSMAKCLIVVDTGSPSALSFQSEPKEDEGTSWEQRIAPDPDDPWEVIPEEVAAFMDEHCPLVRKTAEAVLADIDPEGGSLASE